MSKTILKDEEARTRFVTGINKVAEVVGKTLGASGTIVSITNAYGNVPLTTKDGVTVAKYMMLEDDVENVACMMLKNAAHQTVTDAGDGTTSTIVLAQSMIVEGLKQLTAGAKPQALKKGIDKAVNVVVEHVKLNSESVGDDIAKILDIATISANNDSEIGGLIAGVYKTIGKDGLLSIEKSNTYKTYTKVTDGFKVNRGYIHQGYITDIEKLKAVYDNPRILVTDYTIDKIKDIVDLWNELIMANIPLIIIASDIEGESFGTLLANKIQNGIKVCVIKAPNVYKAEALEDIAKITGAYLISDTNGIKLSSAKLEHLGTCERIIVSDKDTLIIGGGAPKEVVSSHIAYIKTKLEAIEDKDLKEAYEKRLANVSGSAGVIYVGGSTEVEINEKYDRVDDACRSVKSAIEEGVSVGGGVALLRCIDTLNTLEVYSEDERTGVNIVKKALEAPLRQMLANSGDDASFIVRKVKESKGDMGYNVKTGVHEDLRKAGVVDATKVVRVSIQNAASLAGNVIMTNSLMVEVRGTK